MKNLIYIILSICFTSIGFSQTEEETKQQILSFDKQFWSGYNTCDVEKMKPFIDETIEFYHDKGGVTLGSIKLIESIKTNLCSNNNFKIRREIIPNTMAFYTLKNENIIYGAILSGEHYFYVSENGQKESLDGRAKFTHLWILKDKQWKMTRILSYDHKPAH